MGFYDLLQMSDNKGGFALLLGDYSHFAISLLACSDLNCLVQTKPRRSLVRTFEAGMFTN